MRRLWQQKTGPRSFAAAARPEPVRSREPEQETQESESAEPPLHENAHRETAQEQPRWEQRAVLPRRGWSSTCHVSPVLVERPSPLMTRRERLFHDRRGRYSTEPSPPAAQPDCQTRAGDESPEPPPFRAQTADARSPAGDPPRPPTVERAIEGAPPRTVARPGPIASNLHRLPRSALVVRGLPAPQRRPTYSGHTPPDRRSRRVRHGLDPRDRR